MSKRSIIDQHIEIKPEDFDHPYQRQLTAKLDQRTGPFHQNVINEIVLWKVNRYAAISKPTLELLNSISGQKRNSDLTRRILADLLQTKGIRLPMASTILRFRAPQLNQIIDQRAYRLLYGTDLKLNNARKHIESNIDLYEQYLHDLGNLCKLKKIPFHLADRVLYQADKRINHGKRISSR